MTDTTAESIGRFGHHPDPAIDFCIEVDALEGMAIDVRAGLDDAEAFKARLSRALEFRVGGDEGAVRAKDALRKLAAEAFAAESPPDEYAIVEIFGHRRHAGRILEVDRFGAKMLRVDVPTEGDFDKGYTSHFYGGGSIFSLTPTDLATVQRMNRPYRPAGAYLPKPDDADDDGGGIHAGGDEYGDAPA